MLNDIGFNKFANQLKASMVLKTPTNNTGKSPMAPGKSPMAPGKSPMTSKHGQS